MVKQIKGAREGTRPAFYLYVDKQRAAVAVLNIRNIT